MQSVGAIPALLQFFLQDIVPCYQRAGSPPPSLFLSVRLFFEGEKDDSTKYNMIHKVQFISLKGD